MCTLVRLFASMYTLVDSQSRSLDKFLVATRMITAMWPDATVYSLYVELV